jgi:ABC-type nickel/cobalt efflux system permease component RcnA
MPILSDLIQQGSANLWIFIPAALLLGALHGLEPGHSKTMMAAFIIAIRGTVAQAVLLGLSAAFSHSLIIWALAAVALHYGPAWNAETTEPYLQIASAMLILGLAAWMFWRTRRDLQESQAHEHHGHDHHGHPHDHAHHPHDHGHHDHDEPHHHHEHSHHHHHDHQHSHPHHEHHQHHDHHHDHHHHSPHEHHDHSGTTTPEFQDAHERAHAADIERRFANRAVTTPQIIFFGLTGGLMPCPASLTILLVCLQLKKFTLGFTLVLCFSLGLAATMVLTGAIAALSVRHAEKHFKGFGELARKAPYLSCALLVFLGVFFGYSGISHLAR